MTANLLGLLYNRSKTFSQEKVRRKVLIRLRNPRMKANYKEWT